MVLGGLEHAAMASETDALQGYFCSKDSIRTMLFNINKTVRKCRGASAEVLTGALNPILRGWALANAGR
jgi:hypothetical protein